MSRSLQYIFPASTGEEVCKNQALGAAGNLVIDGNLAQGGIASFIDQGYSRQISITSGSDLSGVNFTIFGRQNGVEVTEIIAGPEENTVFSTNIFDTITNVFANNVVDEVSIGAGYNGFFRIIGINLERKNIDYTLTLGKLSNTATAMQIFAGIEDITNNGLTYLDNIDNNYSLVEVKALEVSNQYLYSNVTNPTYSYLLVLLSGMETDLLNSMQLNFIQV